MENRLDEARKIINEVDAQMAELFERRMRAAEMVYGYKKEIGLPILDKAREAIVIEQNANRIADENLKGYYIDFLQNVMSVSRAYQCQMQNGLKVACSGSEIAAERIFPGAQLIACGDFEAAYNSVVNGVNDVAVLPMENSAAGETDQNMDVIFLGSLTINGIYALQNHRDPQHGNDTARFAVLSRVPANAPSLTNSVLMFTVKNAADAPENAIGILGKYGYNITSLERKHSRQHYFYVEMEGSVNTDRGKQMLEALNAACEYVKVAGTYAPHAKI